MNDNKYNLEERVLRFSTDTVKHCSTIEKPVFKPIVEQLIRSATSIGANYYEANNAMSRSDFKSKIYICKKEAGETKYWLKLMFNLGDKSKARDTLEKEAQELLMILQKIVNTLKSKSEK